MLLYRIVMFFRHIRHLYIWRIHCEIYDRIFKHLNGDKDCEYPFQTREELRALIKRDHARVVALLKTIERDSSRMPQAYSEGFRYIAYRDMRQQLERYEKFMRMTSQPRHCDPRFVARRVEA